MTSLVILEVLARIIHRVLTKPTMGVVAMVVVMRETTMNFNIRKITMIRKSLTADVPLEMMKKGTTITSSTVPDRKNITISTKVTIMKPPLHPHLPILVSVLVITPLVQQVPPVPLQALRRFAISKMVLYSEIVVHVMALLIPLAMDIKPLPRLRSD
jgi:hypothetical protein